ncbi:MAG: RNA polymerase sporulation sigma factor SigE [Oscillospiraceae bacterium]|nr:RNA polymerase sporulation sigma factor SigE [Oscillospiraceae bacterium]
MNQKLLNFLIKIGLVHSDEIYYIGGADVLPSPLKGDQEQEALERLERGDEDAKQLLIERNLRLVVFIARRFENTGVNLEDLISIGTIGLIKAVDTYRLDRNIKLATYASRCVENEILMHIRKISNQKTEVSLDEPINMDYDGNELLLSDILGTDEDMIQRPLEDAVDLRVLKQAVEELPERERQIVLMRFGLDGHQELTQKEVAEKMGISQSYISRLEKRIMSRLRKELIRQTSCV